MTITLRLSKLVLVGMVAVFALLVGVNNVVDYDSNFEFVQHVLSMDTTFQNNEFLQLIDTIHSFCLSTIL